MRKIFRKSLAGLTSLALVATLLVGFGVSKEVKAAEAVSLNNWTFIQGGQYEPKEPGNEGYITSAKLTDTDETLSGYLTTGTESVNQEKTASAPSTGFELQIANTGWDCKWSSVTGFPTNRINPWSIQAVMRNVTIEPGHIYTVSFKAYASKKKYGYVAFNCDVPDTPPYGEDLLQGSNSIITLTQAPQEFTYTFTNWVNATKLETVLMLGAFNAQYDYAGNNVSNIITEVENGWNGTVYVSDFSITDNGKNSSVPDVPDKPTVKPTTPNVNNPTTKAPTQNVNTTTKKPTVAKKKLAKVKKLKVKNTKKRTIKITWKKVAKAKSYQVKVGKKTYTTKKVKLTVKKLKKGRRYTVKVRAKAAGYKTGAWATKKIKIKK